MSKIFDVGALAGNFVQIGRLYISFIAQRTQAVAALMLKQVFTPSALTPEFATTR